MMPSFRALTLASALTAVSFSIAAKADPLPAPIADMIQAAAENNDAALTTVVAAAKKTNPASATEIDALAAKLKADATAKQQAKLAQQGAFEGWKGQGEAGISNSTGNTEETTAALGLHFNRIGLIWDNNFDGTVDYDHSNGVTTKSRYFAGYNTRYKFAGPFYATGLLSWEDDRFAGFTRRFTESIGVGYSFIDTPNFLLAA